MTTRDIPPRTFAERLRDATEQTQQRRRVRDRLLGRPGGFTPAVVEAPDVPRQRDEYVDRLRDAG